jgi:hypothetical protein
MQICPVHHGSKRGIQHTQLAGNAEISVTSQGLFHSSSIQLYCASLTLPNHVFQHLFVLLQKPTAAVKAQNAKEHVVVVCEMSHTLGDINVCMLRPEQSSAAVLAQRDVSKKKASKVPSDIDTSCDSDVAIAAAAETRKKKDGELKRKLTATEEENKALERKLADAEAKKKAKLAQLAAVRN